MIKLFKKLFGKKKENKEIVDIPKIKDKDWKVCFICQGEISPEEKKRYFQGKIFHKKCFKKAQSNFFNGKLN